MTVLCMHNQCVSNSASACGSPFCIHNVHQGPTDLAKETNGVCEVSPSGPPVVTRN